MTIHCRRSTNITSTNCNVTTASGAKSDADLHLWPGTQGTKEYAFQTVRLDPPLTNSLLMTISTGTSPTHTASDKWFWQALRLFTSYLVNLTFPNDRTPSHLTNWRTCRSATPLASWGISSTHCEWTSKHHRNSSPIHSASYRDCLAPIVRFSWCWTSNQSRGN